MHIALLALGREWVVGLLRLALWAFFMKTHYRNPTGPGVHAGHKEVSHAALEAGEFRGLELYNFVFTKGC